MSLLDDAMSRLNDGADPTTTASPVVAPAPTSVVPAPTDLSAATAQTPASFTKLTAAPRVASFGVTQRDQGDFAPDFDASPAATPAAAPAPAPAPAPSAEPSLIASARAAALGEPAATPAAAPMTLGGGGEGGSAGNFGYEGSTPYAGSAPYSGSWSQTAPTTGTLQSNGLPAYGDLTNQFQKYFGPLDGKTSGIVNIPGVGPNGGSLPMQRIYADAPTQDQYQRQVTSSGDGSGATYGPDVAAYQAALAAYNATPEWARYAYTTSNPTNQLDGHTQTYFYDPATGQTKANGYDFKNSPSFLLDKLYPAAIISGIGAIAGAGIGGAIGGLGGEAGSGGAGLSAAEDASTLASVGAGGSSAGVAGGAATILDPVLVTGAAASGAGGAAGGAAAAAGAAGSLGNGVTQNPDGSQTGQGVTVTGGNATPAGGGAAAGGSGGAIVASPVDGAPVQQGDPVQVTSQAPAPAPAPAATLPLLSQAPIVQQLMMNIPAQLQTQALQQMQDAKLPPDPSKWSAADLQNYLRLASGIAGLLGAKGGSASNSPAPAPAPGAIQVPSINPFTDPSAASNQAASGLPVKLPTLSSPTITGTPGSSTGAGGVAAAAPTPATAAPVPITSSTAAPVLGSVTSDATVAGQLDRLLAAGSPLIEQAKARAAAAANARGLQNSSMAVQSGEEAATNTILPVAQADAATNATQNLTNQAAGNANVALLENARQANLSASQANASLAEQARQADINAAQNNAKLAETARQFDLSKISEEKLAQLDTDTKVYLANTEASYKDQTQSIAGASDLLQSFNTQVANIMLSDNMDAANKQSAINILAGNLKNSMSVIGDIGKLNLGNILTFSSDAGAPAAAPAPAPAPAPAAASTPAASSTATTPAALGISPTQFASLTAAGFDPANIDQPGTQSWNPTHQTMRQWLNAGEPPSRFLQALL